MGIFLGEENGYPDTTLPKTNLPSSHRKMDFPPGKVRRFRDLELLVLGRVVVFQVPLLFIFSIGAV